MENKDIHNDFSEKEIRDYLSKQYRKERYNCHWNTDINFLKKEIEEHRKMLESAIAYNVLGVLIKNKGWKIFDISDDVKYNEESYFEFIGTEEEFKELINKINKGK